jgi:MFS family permease
VVLRRRLLPLKPPGAVDAVHIPDEELTWPLRIRKHWRYVIYVAGRIFHHARVLPPVVFNGIRWSIAQSGLTVDYWRFYAAALIFNFSLMIFYLLYNLYLAGLGFDEAFVGRVTSAMQVGSLLSTLVAGYAAARVGLRPALIFCFIATGLACALRTLVSGKAELLAFGFAGGAVQSVWAVCLAPTIMALTTDRNRPLAFGLTFATGVGVGMVAGVIGGRLPTLLHSMQNTLLLASVLSPLAVLPLLRLRGLSERFNFEKPIYAANPFLLRFLAALAIWGAATGAFNPFFNLFFSHALHFSVERIGGIFSVTQGAQLAAMLLSPLVLKRFGVGPAIALMQAATGIALAGLGISPPAVAGWVYGMYMSFQCMSEPGMYSLLMSNVPPEQRTGASALNFLTLFGFQAIAAWAAGEAIARYGYRPVLLIAGLLALLAARAMMFVTRSR